MAAADASRDAQLSRRYRAPSWLPGGHAQTVYAAVLAPRPQVRYRRTEWDTPDGDFIDVDWLDGPAGAPLVVLFHGLEGSSRSHYALSLMHEVRARGWRGVVPHFRGCGGRPNRLARAYHSGDFHEVHWILQRIAALAGNVPRFAVGVSLGGNALLKWLAMQGSGAAPTLQAAAAVSAPVDLEVAGHGLGRGFNRLYTWHFLTTLKPKAREKLARHPGIYDGVKVARARDLYQFDNLVTAPLHGFDSADDYWTRASSKSELQRIRLPTLLVHARNDPFLPGRFLPGEAEVSQSVTLEYPDTGGHAGFVTGPFPGRLEWLPRRLLEFFEQARGLSPPYERSAIAAPESRI
jgi:predicted alpha/beta-fold hydrolase